jgi:hypothetical protein
MVAEIDRFIDGGHVDGVATGSGEYPLRITVALPFLDVFAVQEIVTEFLLCDEIGGFVIVL